jgi:hypothetical protein
MVELSMSALLAPPGMEMVVIANVLLVGSFPED